MSTQHDTVKRIESICNEFDFRVTQVGLPIARLELAKALAEAEAENARLQAALSAAVAECDTAFSVFDKLKGRIIYTHNATIIDRLYEIYQQARSARLGGAK